MGLNLGEQVDLWSLVTGSGRLTRDGSVVQGGERRLRERNNGPGSYEYRRTWLFSIYSFGVRSTDL